MEDCRICEALNNKPIIGCIPVDFITPKEDIWIVADDNSEFRNIGFELKE